MILVHDDAMAALMVRSTLGVELAAPFVGHVLLRDDVPVGAFVINGYDGITCDITVVGERIWGRETLTQLAKYVFGQLGCIRASARTRASNTSAINALNRLGFQPEGIQRRGFGDEDAILFGLLARDIRLVRS